VGDIDPSVTIRALQRKDGTWCVCATPLYGLPTYIGDFKSEVEAQNWIIRKAKEHFPKRSRCAEYTEREAAANQGEQHDRFHAVDRLRVDVKFVSEVGHDTSAIRARAISKFVEVPRPDGA
jgi:hypothetical protein